MDVSRPLRVLGQDMDVSRPYLVLRQVVDVSRPYMFNTRCRAYNSPNVEEVSAGGLRITATAQMRQVRNRKKSIIVVYRRSWCICSSGMERVLRVDIAIRGVDIATRGVDILILGVDITSLDVDMGVGG